MIGLSAKHHYFLYTKPTDMRKGFDGLSGIVLEHMNRSPLDGSVYIFINRRKNKMKMLTYEPGGFMLYYKRLEQGTFELPLGDDHSQEVSLSWESLMLIISGISLQKIVRKKRYKRA
ncbi:IS66 family insertion sequence element accessory protein TnpB [Portibacter marinus]|uniref:IS66 family insertion sequence element accessory protein TnpB n=1 Tax=Portibacter marinus TaxID=2898660 RepID=UPI0029E7D90B|nr:IS66 family insertion sequence element accessory protein TnpB [Portibacter marinus]